MKAKTIVKLVFTMLGSLFLCGWITDYQIFIKVEFVVVMSSEIIFLLLHFHQDTRTLISSTRQGAFPMIIPIVSENTKEVLKRDVVSKPVLACTRRHAGGSTKVYSVEMILAFYLKYL